MTMAPLKNQSHSLRSNYSLPLHNYFSTPGYAQKGFKSTEFLVMQIAKFEILRLNFSPKRQIADLAGFPDACSLQKPRCPCWVIAFVVTR